MVVQTKREVEVHCKNILCSIGHYRDVLETFCIQSCTNSCNTSIHHVTWTDNICSCSSLFSSQDANNMLVKNKKNEKEDLQSILTCDITCATACLHNWCTVSSFIMTPVKMTSKQEFDEYWCQCYPMMKVWGVSKRHVQTFPFRGFLKDTIGEIYYYYYFSTQKWGDSELLLSS